VFNIVSEGCDPCVVGKSAHFRDHSLQDQTGFSFIVRRWTSCYHCLGAGEGTPEAIFPDDRLQNYAMQCNITLHYITKKCQITLRNLTLHGLHRLSIVYVIFNFLNGEKTYIDDQSIVRQKLRFCKITLHYITNEITLHYITNYEKLHYIFWFWELTDHDNFLRRRKNGYQFTVYRSYRRP
jgi:hypothetical protein